MKTIFRLALITLLLGLTACTRYVYTDSQAQAQVVYMQRQAPAYTESHSWVNGRMVCDTGAMSWSGHWPSSYNHAPTHRYHYQPQRYRYVPTYQHNPYCGTSYGLSYPYVQPLPPVMRYQYFQDPSGGRNPNWRNH